MHMNYCVYIYPCIQVGGIASNGKMHPMNEFKLLDVPEMGYLTTDKPPRGELCVKTPNMISGYYKNEQEMTDKFIDGYFRTGDIVVMEGEGKVTIIDRKKNLFKLAQGEFVSPERLEVRRHKLMHPVQHAIPAEGHHCVNIYIEVVYTISPIVCMYSIVCYHSSGFHTKGHAI